MIRVLFVCLGNICRSPMGEFIFKDLVKKEGVADRFYIASAGTSSEEEGNPVYPPARAELARHGIDCSGKFAVQYTAADYKKYDYILAMETWHVQSILRRTPDPEGKVKRLLDFTSRPADIADPWYTRNFAGAYSDIERGCIAFLRYLKDSGKIGRR